MTNQSILQPNTIIAIFANKFCKEKKKREVLILLRVIRVHRELEGKKKKKEERGIKKWNRMENNKRK